MVDLPKKKVGIVACSGEELAEGTVTRLASLKVLEQLRPGETVTICLPLFLAGGEGDRAFARFYPTIAVDGCELRCAARATEMYSGKPAASLIVRDVVAQEGLDQPQGLRRLNPAGEAAVNATAERLAETVDELLGQRWSRSASKFIAATDIPLAGNQPAQEPIEATCSCGSGIPIRKLVIEGQSVTLIALPLIFENFRQQGKLAGNGTERELMDMVKIYNPIPPESEAAYTAALIREYADFCANPETTK
jgi:uncharacterized metal-binding protein